ncbi:MAG: NAD(P)H-dependent oxidoreductase subunit E [Eubacteriales bacterium]|nr:NAD(P)H-dependent oxidoreductase subunit E [Eubacteriales bacterium]MDD3349706.1 NAD(P)H-dependent oxidoreductase subunit E [Eubacteriales bacterium]
MQNECKCNCNTADDPRYVELKAYIDSVKGNEGIAMSVLQEAQTIFGYLPLEVQKFISQNIDVPLAELYGVSTFYSQFTLTPRGKHHIGICLGTACYVRGAQKLVDKFVAELKIAVGETTEDGLFTLDATRCLGCCGLAPVIMIDEDVYGKLDDVDAIPGILDKYRG